MNDTEVLLLKIKMIRDFTETEGVKQLCDILSQLIEENREHELGFKVRVLHD